MCVCVCGFGGGVCVCGGGGGGLTRTIVFQFSFLYVSVSHTRNARNPPPPTHTHTHRHPTPSALPPTHPPQKIFYTVAVAARKSEHAYWGAHAALTNTFLYSHRVRPRRGRISRTFFGLCHLPQLVRFLGIKLRGNTSSLCLHSTGRL